MKIDNGLLEKYRSLLTENSALREENEILKARLGITSQQRPDRLQDLNNNVSQVFAAPEMPEIKPQPGIPAQLDPAEKIQLFTRLK